MNTFSLAQSWWQLVVIAVVGYGFGCVNFAKLISAAKGGDITKEGSGNPGTMNMFRNFGFVGGALTFIGDALKGGLPVLIVHLLYRNYLFAGTDVLVSDFMRYFVGLCVVLGHVFPVTMSFKGGKGIASTFGLFWMALSCENAWWILYGAIVVVAILLFIFLSEWGSLGSLLGVSTYCIAQGVHFFLRYQYSPVNAYLVWTFVFMFAIEIVTWCAHHQNLLRLFSGEEHRTSFKKILKKKEK